MGVVILGALLVLPYLLTTALVIAVPLALVGGTVFLLWNPGTRNGIIVLISIGLLLATPYRIREAGSISIILRRLLIILTPTFSVTGAAAKEIQLKLLEKQKAEVIDLKKQQCVEAAVQKLDSIKLKLERKFGRYPSFHIELVGGELKGLLEGSDHDELFSIVASTNYPESTKPKFAIRSASAYTEITQVGQVLQIVRPVIKKALVEKEKLRLLTAIEGPRKG